MAYRTPYETLDALQDILVSDTDVIEHVRGTRFRIHFRYRDAQKQLQRAATLIYDSNGLPEPYLDVEFVHTLTPDERCRRGWREFLYALNRMDTFASDCERSGLIPPVR